MSSTTLRELLQSIKNNNLADYVTNNYWKMDKETLKALVVQLALTLYDNNLTEKDIDMNELLDRIDLE